MIELKKNRFKPKFKTFNNNKLLVSYKQKLLTFRKQKWSKIRDRLKKITITKKQNCYYKFYDQQSYLVNKFTNKFTNKFRYYIINKRIFKNLFGNIKKRKIKALLRIKNSNQNCILKRLIFKQTIRKRLENELTYILIKSYLALNLRDAKQLINHGHVKINNHIVKSHSSLIKVGDKITFSNYIKPLLEYRVAYNIMWPLIPKNIQISYKIFQIIIINNSFLNNVSNSLESTFDFEDIFK